jgi:hypothetical protein
MRRSILLMMAMLALLTDQFASAEVRIAGRHVYILQPGLSEIWGSYVFLVEASVDGEEASMPLLLPKEKREFGPQEGVTNEELQFDPATGVILKKKFNVGSNLLAVGFNVSAQDGQALMSLDTAGGVQDISFMVPVGQMKVTGPNLSFEPNVNFIGRNFDTYVYKSSDNVPGVLQFTVQGVPEGRADYWVAGAGYALLLLVLGGFLAWRSTPKSESGEDIFFDEEASTQLTQ